MRRFNWKAWALSAACLAFAGQTSAAGENENRLAEAVKARDHAAIKRLLDGGAQPNQVLADHSLPLGWAIDRHDHEAVRLLLAAGADANAKNFYGDPMLVTACALGEEGVIKELLEKGADPKASRGDGISALALCAGTSTSSVIKLLTEKGADVNAADAQGQTPLMRAAAAGAVDNIGMLLTLKANINAATAKGATPLFFALQGRASGAADMLLDSGADHKGLTPEGANFVEAALAVKDQAFAARVITKGVDLDRRDARGYQLIHFLAEGGYAELVQLALSKGANVNALTSPPAPDPKTQVATLNAGEAGAKEKGPAKKPLEISREELAKPPPPAPRTPLMLAARAGKADVMKALIEAKANRKIKVPDGMTVTLAAAASANLPTVTYALELDPDLSATAQGGRGVLHMAVIRPESVTATMQVLTFLADKGAKFDHLDDKGLTAADYVNRLGPDPMRAAYAKLLKDHGLEMPPRKSE